MASNNGYKVFFSTADGTYKLDKLTVDGVEYTVKQTSYDSVESETLIKQLYSGTVVNAVVPDGLTSIVSLFSNSSSLISIDFNEVITIPHSCCNNCANLESVQFGSNLTRIEPNAFRRCTKIDGLSIPNTVNYIGDYAFSGVGTYYNQGTHTFEFINDVNVETFLESSAFYNSHLSKFDGTVSHCGDSAFYNCFSLTYVDIKFDNCYAGARIFYGCSNVSYFHIDSASTITQLNYETFYQLASNTYATATIDPFDFRNSTLTSLPSGVWGNCSFDGIVYFPNTLNTINGNFLSNASGNWTLYFLSVPTVDGSDYLRDDISGFSVKYCFEYTLLDTASSATNWTAHTSQMLGFGAGFTAGSTLPATTTGGITLTWYSDIGLTTQITTSASETDTYYCVMS